MAPTERQGMHGRLTLVLRDARGREVERRVVDNHITLAGRALVAGIFSGVVQGASRLYIAVGRGRLQGDTNPARPPADGDTALVAQVDRAEATTSVRGTIATITATLPARGGAEPQPIEEAGIQIEVGGGQPVLYNRVIFPVVNKSPNMEMTLSWEVSF